MKTITVRLNESENRVFSEYAKFYNMPLSTLFKKTLEEKIEDELDLKAIYEYEKDVQEGKLEARPIEELFEELNL